MDATPGISFGQRVRPNHRWVVVDSSMCDNLSLSNYTCLWSSLPAVSDDLKPIINDGNNSIENLSNFRTTIGANVLGLKTLLRETAKDPNASVNLGGTGKSRGLQVPPAIYKRFIPPPPLPEIVKNTKLLSHVASESPSQLIVVLCSDRGAGECRIAEKAYARIHKNTNALCKKQGIR